MQEMCLGCQEVSEISTGPHLHLTKKKDGKVFDPIFLLEYVKHLLCLKV